MMKRAALFASATVLSAGVLLGQSQNGSIAGVITDQGGAVVAGATITITNVNTGAVRTTTTDRAGTYSVQGLLPQDYRVTVKAEGFAESEAKLNVSVGSSNTINVKLAVGQQSVTVDVAANSLAGINLENAEQSQVIDSAQILELPTETRNAYDFVGLSGSVSSDPSASSRGVQGFNLNGARSASTEILLDGIENTGLFAVGVATQVPVDSVQEYRVITNNFGPEYGRASGGVVSVITKGGTNKFHGTAYEFYRPSTFASNSYYNNANGIPKKRFVRNAFGYSIGGPIIKDKLFFFNNTEWTRVRSSNVVQFYIPTAQLIAASNANTQAFFQKFGTVSGTPTGKVLTLGQVGGAPGYVSTAFATDRTTLESRFPGVFNDNFPIMQQVNVTVPVDAGGGTPVNQYNTDGRIDFNLGTKTQMFGRYVLYNQAFFPGSVNNSPYAGYNTSETVKSQNLVYGLTHTFNDRFTGQLQIGLLRYNDNQPLGDNPVGPTLFVNSGSAPTIANNQFVFPGYNEKSAGNGLPSGGPQNNIVVSPDFTLLRGRHTFSFGGTYDYIRDNHTFAIYANAQEALLQSGTNGALVNFQNGVFNFFQANLDPQGKFPCVKDLVTGVVNQTAACTINTPISQPSFARSNRYHEGAGYFNDTFKATPRLTLNAGLRYELYGTQHNKNSALDSNFYFGTSGTLQDRIRAGKILNVNSPAPAGVQNPGGKLWNTNYKQFAPRIAFAYDLFGDGKTSLRGGYGISYERNFGNVTYNVALNPPAQLAISFTNVDVGSQIPISTGVLGSFSGGPGVSKAIPPGTVRAVDPKIKPAYAQFFSLSVEHQMAGNLTLGLAYNGSRGVHNYSIANYNRSFYGRVYEGDAARYQPSGANNTNRLNPQFTSINVRAADGDSYYHGLNLSARAGNLFNTGLTMTTNYTYSHSTDNTSSTFTDGGSNNVNSVAYFDPFNHALDHGNSDFDQKHRISVGVVYQVPFAGSGLTKRVLGGWEFGGIFQAGTGTPFSMYDCGQSIVTVCPRARFVNKPSYQRTGNSTPTPGTPDQFAYINFPTYYVAGTTQRNAANYPTYKDPVVGYADLPTILNGYDTFPGGMTSRNAFRGPGNFMFNADLNKRILITERVSLQLRAELYNVLNHANSYLNLGGANDVSSTPYVSVYKNGPGQGGNRQLQLAGKIIF